MRGLRENLKPNVAHQSLLSNFVEHEWVPDLKKLKFLALV